MPAAIAIPLIIGGASAAASIYGAKKQADTSLQAAGIQSDAAKQAMAYTQGNTNQALQYIMAQQQGIRNPMNASPAYARMYQGLGLGQQFKDYGYGPPPGGFPPQGGAAAPPSSGTQMITLQSPDGQTKQFDPNDPNVQHYLQRGATRI